jgi:hypothetical protein
VNQCHTPKSCQFINKNLADMALTEVKHKTYATCWDRVDNYVATTRFSVCASRNRNWQMATELKTRRIVRLLHSRHVYRQFTTKCFLHDWQCGCQRVTKVHSGRSSCNFWHLKLTICNNIKTEYLNYFEFIHSSISLQPYLGPWPLLQFRNRFYTDCRTPWTSDQPVARPLPTHRTTQIQN